MNLRLGSCNTSNLDRSFIMNNLRFIKGIYDWLSIWPINPIAYLGYFGKCNSFVFTVIVYFS
jgi:hypothetical protein